MRSDNEITKVIETRLIAYGRLYVKKPPMYWSNLSESFTNARNATRRAKSLKSRKLKVQNRVNNKKCLFYH